MEIMFHQDAWEDYLYFQEHHPQFATKINNLIKDIQRNKYSGIGKPEPLKFNLKGFWSRRINSEHRIVYTIKNDTIYILQCRYHY